jgi:hypothetical protein
MILAHIAGVPVEETLLGLVRPGVPLRASARH